MTHDERKNSSDTGSKVPTIQDELLAKINANLCGIYGCDGEHYKKDNLNGEWFALRAVVETVQAYEKRDVIANEEFDQGIRSVCRVIIQAIEEELR